MKTFAPGVLHGRDLRRLISELCTTPHDVARFLKVTERTVWRWIADDGAPFAALAALWHETPAGRHASALDVGNELAIHSALANSHAQRAEAGRHHLAGLLAIADTGSANDPLIAGPAGRFYGAPRPMVPPGWQNPASMAMPAPLSASRRPTGV